MAFAHSGRTLRLSTAAAVVGVSALALTGCGLFADDEFPVGTENEDGTTTLTVGVSPVPQGDILRFIDEELAADAGLALDVVEYQDYTEPNPALVAGELDANYFQHQPWFESEVEGQGYELAHYDGVHVEPFALFSERHDTLEELPEGGQIGVNNDPSNQGRALAMLADADLIEIAEGVDPAEATINDVAENPRDFEFIEADAASLARTLDDVDASVINGNNALEIGLSPTQDSLLVEDPEGSPYANFLAVREGTEDDENLQKLDELLHSDEVRDFIEETWPDGEVAPAF
ncbi:MetQ/NlpA family ABC transporter substrate-binding protein [Nesterenkonia sp. HG001]|uniref:MetQ/NlpA family ABC transporter substrate-binding protein n=1 Tax=Nesterenkonia sp. HG001 TaxID=2983207 RepID=UPI002AC68D86|nr:MetQ/NlpA family ABC transporter substrate-binding protein [Nesterenkonia sp. HG001]MDZ5077049.1 MetQ/NlpA family ABC transporter substrate-binding protein [Nesterenkonia sp. HG001]